MIYWFGYKENRLHHDEIPILPKWFISMDSKTFMLHFIWLQAWYLQLEYRITSNLMRILIQYRLSENFLNFHLHFTHQRRQQKTALKDSNTSIYVDFHHILGRGMYINWIVKSRNPRNSNLVRKNRGNDYFRAREKTMV